MNNTEPTAEEKCHKYILEVLSGENGAFTKDGAKSTLDKACEYHTKSRLQAIVEEVSAELERYNWTDEEIFGITQIITKHLDQ